LDKLNQDLTKTHSLQDQKRWLPYDNPIKLTNQK